MQQQEGMRFLLETPEAHASRESQAFIHREIERPSKVWVQEVVESDRESEFVKLRTADFVLLPDLNGNRRQTRAFRARPLQVVGRYDVQGWRQESPQCGQWKQENPQWRQENPQWRQENPQWRQENPQWRQENTQWRQGHEFSQWRQGQGQEYPQWRQGQGQEYTQWRQGQGQEYPQWRQGQGQPHDAGACEWGARGFGHGQHLRARSWPVEGGGYKAQSYRGGDGSPKRGSGDIKGGDKPALEITGNALALLETTETVEGTGDAHKIVENTGDAHETVENTSGAQASKVLEVSEVALALPGSDRSEPLALPGSDRSEPLALPGSDRSEPLAVAVAKAKHRPRFNWLAIVADPSLRSLRDLRGEHIGMLEGLYAQCVEAIQREYKDVRLEDIMAFANYPPSVYKLHFHFCAPFFQPSAYDAFRMHSISGIINNLRIHPLYYQISSLQIPVHSGSDLYRAIGCGEESGQQWDDFGVCEKMQGGSRQTQV